MSKNREKKIQLVAKIAQKLAYAKSVIFTDYRGLNVAQMSQLRHRISKVGAEFHVIKNTLLQLALKQAGYPKQEDPQLFTGPTASLVAFEDEVAAVKELNNFIQLNDLPKIKAGFLGKRFLSADDINKLAKLPPRDVLLTQTLNTLSYPLTGLVFTLQANMIKLVSILKNVAQKTEGGD